MMSRYLTMSLLAGNLQRVQKRDLIRGNMMREWAEGEDEEY